ncbi:MAG: uncharacterized protein JWN53_1127 [Gemmatimonadetes bacterium]|jgi:hypothetical protein|nr:uncharacterized protein [Gemmatimonadota bacterium]
MSTTLPIACSLTPAALETERDALLPGLVVHAVRRVPLPRGMRFVFAATAERLRQIAGVMRRERECCDFLDFRLDFALGVASLTLDVTGPAGTVEFLASLVGTVQAA